MTMPVKIVYLLFLAALCTLVSSCNDDDTTIVYCDADNDCTSDGNNGSPGDWNDFPPAAGCNDFTNSAVVLEPADYQVTLNSSFVTPVANPAGVAVDDRCVLWIMGSDGEGHKLIAWNRDTGEILRSYTYENLTALPGTKVYGITWDDSTIWISVTGKLIQVDPLTGDVLRETSSPAWSGPSDLSWDGTDLWISDGQGHIYKINPVDGSLAKFRTLPSEERDSGIAIRKNREIWIGYLFNSDLSVYNPDNKREIDRVSNALYADGARGLAFFQEQLVMVTDAGIDFYDITDPGSGLNP